VPDTDTDLDGTADCNDGCPTDAGKVAPGVCGCGVADTDSDGDATPDCNDGCPADSGKTAPGVCGCGIADIDTDADGTLDCNDNCAMDPNKVDPGACGCGVPDTDTDSDGVADCNDGCPADNQKTAPGICGCGVSDVDSDGDGQQAPIRRQLEAFATLAVAVDGVYTVDVRQLHFQSINIGIIGQVDGGIGTECAVMNDVRIRDRQYDPGDAFAQRLVESILEIDHIRCAGLIVLGIHAVIGGESNDRSQLVESGPVVIHHGVERICARATGRMLVLHKVSCRQVHDIRSDALHQLDAGGEYEFR